MIPIWRIKDRLLFNGCYKTIRMFRKVSLGWTSRNEPELMYCTGYLIPIILERANPKAATSVWLKDTHLCWYVGTLLPLEPSRFLAGCTLPSSWMSGIISSVFSTLTVLWPVHEKLKDKQTQLHNWAPLQNDRSLVYQFLSSKVQLVHFIARTYFLSWAFALDKVLSRKCHFWVV